MTDMEGMDNNLDLFLFTVLEKIKKHYESQMGNVYNKELSEKLDLINRLLEIEDEEYKAYKNQVEGAI